MKALTVHQPFAQDILCGDKTVEYRTWRTKHRGDLLICSAVSNDKVLKDYCILGHALGIVELYDIREGEEGFEWLLRNPRFVKPFPVRGMPGVFNVDVEPEVLTTDFEEAITYWYDNGYLDINVLLAAEPDEIK